MANNKLWRQRLAETIKGLSLFICNVLVTFKIKYFVDVL